MLWMPSPLSKCRSMVTASRADSRRAASSPGISSTPVLAFRCGSVPEIIDPGVTGLIVDSMDEAIRVMPQVLALDRRAVRQKFEQRFSASRMAKDYVQVYRSLIKQQALPERDAPVSRRQPELEQGMN